MSTSLKLCPFCGKQPVIVNIKPHSHKGGIAAFMPDHPGSSYVECGCGAGLIDATEELVVKRWNCRFDHAPDQSLSILVKQYALDLRRNASGGDDYPYEYAKATADYLEELIRRAKGNCTCAQGGFPDSCDNCDGLAPTPANTASLDALYECVRDASTENGEMSDFISTDEMIAISEAVLQKFHVIPRVSDTSTDGEGSDHA